VKESKKAMMKTAQTQIKKPKPPHGLEALIKDALRDFDEELIHSLRLEVKKMKAYMRLLKTTGSRFDYKKNVKNLFPFYKDLGFVRETQLQKNKIETLNMSLKPSFKKKFFQLLADDLEEREDRLLRHFDENTIKDFKKVQRKIKSALKGLSASDFKMYLKKRTNKLKNQIQKMDLSEDKMHNLRSTIKEIKYNIPLHKKTADTFFIKENIDFRLLEDLQNWLGEWRDNQMMREKITRNEGALFLQNGEKETVMQLKTSLEVDNDFLKNKIKKAVGLD
jgi:CHAD domain-containing protein